MPFRPAYRAQPRDRVARQSTHPMRRVSIATSSIQSSKGSVLVWYSCHPNHTLVNCGSRYGFVFPPCTVSDVVSDGCGVASHQNCVSLVSPLCIHSRQIHSPVGTARGAPSGSSSEVVQSPVPPSVRLSVPTPKRFLPFWSCPLTRISPGTPVPLAATTVQCAYVMPG